MIKREAVVYANEKFFCIATLSGKGLYGIDPAGELSFLERSAESAEIGKAVRSALTASRMLEGDELRSFFNRDSVKLRYENWVADLIARFGYKNRRALFRDMKKCNVSCSEEGLKIQPSVHDRLESWTGTGLEGKDEIHLSEGASFEELGQGVLLGMQRSTA
jgi:CDI immunity protein